MQTYQCCSAKMYLFTYVYTWPRLGRTDADGHVLPVVIVGRKYLILRQRLSILWIQGKDPRPIPAVIVCVQYPWM